MIWIGFISLLGCRVQMEVLTQPKQEGFPGPPLLPASSPTPMPTRSPSPTAVPTSTPVATPVPTAIWKFDPVRSANLAAPTNSIWVPEPWYADYCGKGSLGSDSSGKNFKFTVRDGCVWKQLNSSAIYTYARAELALVGGAQAFPAERVTTVEWKGYFTQPLPSYVSGGSVFIAPFQIHNKNNTSPMYALAVDIKSRKLVLTQHSLTGRFVAHHPLVDYNLLLNRSTDVKLRILNTGSTQGFVTVAVNGQTVFSQSGIATTSTPGQDYVKFGIYDWGSVIVSPAQPSRGRVFDLITETFQVSYR